MTNTKIAPNRDRTLALIDQALTIHAAIPTLKKLKKFNITIQANMDELCYKLANQLALELEFSDELSKNLKKTETKFTKPKGPLKTEADFKAAILVAFEGVENVAGGPVFLTLDDLFKKVGRNKNKIRETLAKMAKAEIVDETLWVGKLIWCIHTPGASWGAFE